MGTILKAIFLSIGISMSLMLYSKNEISVADFGAYPNDEKDDAVALRKAATYCRTHSGVTLYFPPGTYNFRDEKAADIERRAFSGALGRGLEVQRRLFHPELPYVKGLDFAGSRNLTISAYGAKLVVEGWMEVVSFVKTKNVRLEGLTITMKRPASTEGRIVRSEKDFFEMEFDPNVYPYIDSVVQGRYHFYSPSKTTIYYGDFRDPELLRPGYIRFKSSSNPPLNDICVIRCGGHYRPCIMIKESDNVTIKDVSILSFAGMGIVGHLTHDIMVDGLKIVPEFGRATSTNTDATHFTSCSGKLTIQNSIFEGNCDDCTNVHNYYYQIIPQEDSPKKVEIRIVNADLHAQSLDYPSKGDTLLVIKSDSMEKTGSYVVEKVDTSTANWKVVVTLNKPFDKTDVEHRLMYNYTRFPEVRILNNFVSYNLARGFLLKARKVRIAGNYIRHSTLCAIKLGAELGWREAGPVESAVIENNYFLDTSTSDAYASCLQVSTEARATPPMLNHGIIFRNNICNTSIPDAFAINDAYDVVITGNYIKNGGIKTSNSKDVVYKDNY
jgi:hypothetical protein